MICFPTHEVAAKSDILIVDHFQKSSIISTNKYFNANLELEKHNELTNYRAEVADVTF